MLACLRLRLTRNALLALALLAGLLATPAAAQKIGREHFEDKTNGYRIRYPKDWAPVPLTPEWRARGLSARFKGEGMSVNAKNFAGSWEPDLYVHVLERAKALTGEGTASGLRGRVKTTPKVISIEDRIAGFYFKDFDRDNPVVDERKKFKKLTARHRVWDAGFRSQVGAIPMKVDVWTFALGDRDVSLTFTMMEQHYKKWKKTFYSVAKTFEEIEREKAKSIKGEDEYASILSFHEEEAAQIPGWRVLPTASERFIVKTSSGSDKFIDEVIERLERSRDLFERDFPPENPIEDVSVVRVCGTREEFNNYGGTSGGVVGWFNPSSKELVLFDASRIDKKISHAVMTHEAFHQYCHFLFDESEAHRWFDEGHGDYYGAFKFRGKKAQVTSQMPSGLDRLTVLRTLMRTNAWVPIKEHINYDHSQWQSKGVPSYAQSWSIIYMLRQGMLGKVPRSVWKKEYADILPNYMAQLYEGFQKEYSKQRSVAEAAAKRSKAEFDADSLEYDVDLGTRNKIWKAAIAASWGKIDIGQFEEDWLKFCNKHLK